MSRKPHYVGTGWSGQEEPYAIGSGRGSNPGLSRGHADITIKGTWSCHLITLATGLSCLMLRCRGYQTPLSRERRRSVWDVGSTLVHSIFSRGHLLSQRVLCRLASWVAHDMLKFRIASIISSLFPVNSLIPHFPCIHASHPRDNSNSMRTHLAAPGLFRFTK